MSLPRPDFAARTILALGLCAATFGFGPGARAQTITQDEARSIATAAYIYFYPLITMDVTRKQLTNIPPGESGIGGPMNSFVNVPAFPTAEMRSVVRPNFDTLYSSAWIDLTREPMVISAPDTGGRYYLLPMLDMWTDVFASPGWRTTGTQAGNFLLTPPGWTGSVPDGFSRIQAPTPYVWIIGRTKTDGPSDYDAVHKIQAGFKVTPLSEWGKPPKPVEARIDPSVDVKTPPKVQVDSMAGDKFFAYAAQLLKQHPPHATDQPMIARLKRIGFEAGKDFDTARLDPVVKKEIDSAPKNAQSLMEWKVPTLARVANHWSMNTDTMGVYGNYYLKRAIVAQFGLGANLPEDAIYPLNLGDETGRPLDGADKYTLRFDANALPPADAFWSVTLYDKDGFQVANSLDRFALSSWMPLQHDPDGSLTLYVQNDSPGKDREANWLPAPKGPFNLTMRIYAPKADALTGRWNPPSVTKPPAAPSLAAQ
ncbi:DUF1254 domain-containing protein [Microvirga mediterraneensis]|uniref:DUF1254 domain-containing protein n=1 Tax=Microvirga mediterraneensis TaxID=2754695 RepID=A0A838BQI3_9HYPH|nr:DUF1254 domain-containing protein [Microvirga mediterraneensis]MBA1157641.1 DUF1254 domain-containing protein [Microvirga mediterraneensis]